MAAVCSDQRRAWPWLSRKCFLHRQRNTVNPQLMTVIESTISLVIHDGRKAGQHVTGPGFRTSFAVVVKRTLRLLSERHCR